MINKIDNIHKKFFVILSILSLFLFYTFAISPSIDYQVYFLFFLVSAIGIPHGFFDFSIGKKIFKKYHGKWILYFTLIYICISFIYFLAWILLPGISLLLFLFLAAYHFGFEDYNYMRETTQVVYIDINIFIKGLIIVFTPILFHFDQVNYLFSILIGYKIGGIEFTFIQKMLFIFLSATHILFEKKKSYLHKTEGILCFLNFVVLPPLVSFILYFCFMHSIRHFLESIYISKLVPNNFTTKNFLIIIILTSLFFSSLSVFFISNFYDISISNTVIKFIFIILACLTLPHMIFNMVPYDEK
ncbi:Brp/Blh family beta-carotene 15,15'-dioxygenase [Gammaproteobacteria bacterium]|nr:Brp/Blh family beta-carotene 15,15'-dioxygenase [Gammaproteobacteria bacterium]